jgi:hypothetical protein
MELCGIEEIEAEKSLDSARCIEATFLGTVLSKGAVPVSVSSSMTELRRFIARIRLKRPSLIKSSKRGIF